jgi:hypothetical protein
MFRLTGCRVDGTGFKPKRFKLNRGLLFGMTLLGLLGGVSYGLAGTVVSGNAAGVWGLPGSPHWVEGDIVVPSASALVIEPGVAWSQLTPGP